MTSGAATRRSHRDSMNMIHTNAKPSFTPSPGQVRAAELVFAAKAHLALIEPIVRSYQRRILAENRWVRAACYRAIRTDTEEVLDPKEAWTLGDQDHARYVALCAEAAKQASLTVREGSCPLLVAEDVLMQAKNLLVREMDGVGGLHVDSVLMLPSEKYQAVIDLYLKLLAPHVGNAKQVLGSLGIEPPAPKGATA